MEYKNITKGKFINRPNRFIANVEIDGNIQVCHVKNTGRCKELLVLNATVYLEKSNNPNRKTQYDLVTVKKGNLLINMDSQAPNKIFREWAENSGYFENLTKIKSEVTFGSSRLDFYLETPQYKAYAEIKGVTLEEKGIVKFPDAPTQRGVKHLQELITAVKNGYKAYAVFIVQMEKAKYFTPNYTTHPEFGNALKQAQENGVEIIALTCKVTPNSVTPLTQIPIVL